MAIETIINTVRHGKTGFNAARRYAGSIDISLSQEGIRDCKAAVKKLEGVKFDVVVTSTLRRAIETAEILAGSSKNMVKSKLCVERNFGIFEGKTWDEVQDIHPPVLYITVGNDLHSVNPQGSEPFEDVWMRAKKFRNYLFHYYRGKKILVVSHGVFLQMFHGVLRGSSCIESLSACPSSLESSTFRFLGYRLVEEKKRKLVSDKSKF
jgi:broad specificity phosphatase PhoE